MSSFDYDVAIIGSGPSGIGAATALSEAGIKNIVVFERETEIGGIPRHTHHPSFGLLVFKRPISGPKYIQALRKRCPSVRFETSTTVTALLKDGYMKIATPKGVKAIRAKHIILATGARETPRHGRLTSGLRPQGITTTGALQQFIYDANMAPFSHAVIVGTELVSFSALWTLRSASIRPAAMIEESSRITAYRPAALFARLLRVPIYYNSKVTQIDGIEKTRGLEIEIAGSRRKTISCDGIIFSGKFVGDNNVARACHLTLNPTTQLPLVDQNWVSSDPNISVIGNAVHPADMGDHCYIEGLSAGKTVAEILRNGIEDYEVVEITHDAGIKLTTPSIVRLKGQEETKINISLHVNAPYSGNVTVKLGDKIVYQTSKRCRPARRITLKNIPIIEAHSGGKQPIHVSLADI